MQQQVKEVRALPNYRPGFYSALTFSWTMPFLLVD
jgi:hypothetical protein